MKVLDVGCGVGAPAREIVKSTGVNVIGLNKDYQIERASQYAAREGLSNQLTFVNDDFMVCARSALWKRKIVTCQSLLANAIPSRVFRCSLRHRSYCPCPFFEGCLLRNLQGPPAWRSIRGL
jgi:hypothetical protein